MDLQQQLQQILSNQSSFGVTNPILLPRKEIDQVDGEQGARNFPMGPNSSCIALDRTKSLLAWFIQTDASGNKTVVAGYTLTPYVPEQPPDFNKMQNLMESMATKLDEQSTAFESLTQRVQKMEEAFK